MSVKKKYEVVQPPLSAYPLNRASGKVELLDAFTIYKWDGHYWFAVLKLRSTFGDPPRSKISIRGYRWQWKRPYSRRGEAEQRYDDVKRAGQFSRLARNARRIPPSRPEPV